MALTPKFENVLLQQNQPLPHAAINEAQLRFDVACNCAVKNQTLLTPPGSPANGDVYRVNPVGVATGAWLNREGQVAFYYNGWDFLTPWVGFEFMDESNNGGDPNTMFVFTTAAVSGASPGATKSWTIA